MLYINHSGKYIEINFNVKIPFSYIERKGSNKALGRCLCCFPNPLDFIRMPFPFLSKTVNSDNLGEIDATAACPRVHSIRGVSTANFLRYWLVSKVLEAGT